jgi:acyl-CoA hydrolase
MISAPMGPLLNEDVFSLGVVAGVALGDQAFYELAAGHDQVRFRDVEITHGLASLAAISRLVAVNSVIEVDLLGQANAETVGGKPITGQGGLIDFVRGAQASVGGRSILALPSTARGGTVSRICPQLPTGTPVTVPRGDADIVVTEHGVANLRNASVDQRAERLIAVAAPAFRPHLSDAWETRHSRSGERSCQAR